MLTVLSVAPTSAPSTMKTGKSPNHLSRSHPPAINSNTPAANAHPSPEYRYTYTKLRRGALVCVFDATDRIQHMFWRYLEEGHPAGANSEEAEHKDAIEELYRFNDELLGRVMERMGSDDLLMVLSDHGFTSFRRGVNLNSWLLANGYLKLKEGADGSAEWLRDVDWSGTRAYALGLTGLFLNLEGREAEGTVRPGEEAEALKAELISKLNGLEDEEKSEIGINEAFDTAHIYRGPYAGNAPDLLIGFHVGYRVSWSCATGTIDEEIFDDNTKSWSGDHCMNPPDVPGIFLCNRKLATDRISIMDVGPTVLDLFGVPVPSWCDGESRMPAGTEG